MKKEKTIKTIISVFVSLILLCGSGLLVYYLYKLKGIEDFIDTYLWHLLYL